MKRNPQDQFLALSAALTGFSQVDLLGTGVAGQYYDTLVGIVPAPICRELWEVTAKVIQQGAGDERELEAAIRRDILADPKFNPLAKNIIVMWYLGNWNELPASWRARYGTSPNDTTRVVSATAYTESLVLRAAGSHPQGAKQPGFGTWSLPPRDELV